MKVIDLNILLYASNSESPDYLKACEWIEKAFSGEEEVGLPWVVILGFVRISTHPKIFARPLLPPESLAIVDRWLSAPSVSVLHPKEDHWETLKKVLSDLERITSDAITDSHIAAIAIENDAVLVTADKGFQGIGNLHLENPLEV